MIQELMVKSCWGTPENYINSCLLIAIMQDTDETRSTVHAVETSLDIVNVIQRLDNPGITKIATELDLPKSTVFNHVRTLEQNKYIVEIPPGGYRLGLELLDNGIHARNNLGVFTASSPAIEQLAEETGLAVWLAVEEYGKVVCIKKQLGDRAVPTRGEIGRRLHMHSSSLGKAILAHLPTERVKDIIETYGLPKRTEYTISDPEALCDELDTIREQEYALNDGESMDGLRAVASPIFSESAIDGAICVAGTRSHMDGNYFEAELPARVKDAANEIELNLLYDT